MGDELRFLAVIAAIFVLSLGGAYVLFRLLRSSAWIKKPGYEAGGALAGFLLIYGALYWSFDRLVKPAERWRPTAWTVVGTITREDSSTHEGIVIRHIPPKPSALTDLSGTFRLENVLVMRGEGWPEIYIENPGYYPRPVRIAEDNAVIDTAGRMITLKREFAIKKVPR